MLNFRFSEVLGMEDCHFLHPDSEALLHDIHGLQLVSFELISTVANPGVTCASADLESGKEEEWERESEITGGRVNVHLTLEVVCMVCMY